jgi:hypothetical protein
METVINFNENNRTISQWLFNPFYYIAGGKSLLIGIISILITGILAYQGNFHFNGVIDINFRLTSSYWLSISELTISWLLMGILLYITGKIISKSHIRIIDVFGTQALAWIPDLFIALAAMIPGSHRFVRTLIDSLSHGKPPIISLDMAAFIITMITYILMTIWMVALMYRAFAISCNVSGRKAAVCFTISLFVGEIISIIIFSQFPKP